MKLSLGNYLGAKKGLPYPTAGLDVIVYNSTYEDGGTTYYRTSKGIGLPVISGTGLDTIIDFSVLLVGGKKDLRFNKNAYVGSSYTDDEGNPLPANYNFPFVGIYYDSANPYYWKITDFAYAVILAQSLLVDNMFFLKATATTNTSNVIATWDKLFIYTTALADNNLAKMKTYIGIQDTFYSDELFVLANAVSDNSGNEANATTGFNQVGLNVGSNVFASQSVVVNSGNYAIKADCSPTPTADARFYIDLDTLGLSANATHVITTYIRHTGIGSPWRYRMTSNSGLTSDVKELALISNTDITFARIETTFIAKAENRFLGCRESNASNDGGVYLDNLSIKQKYENYYMGFF